MYTCMVSQICYAMHNKAQFDHNPGVKLHVTFWMHKHPQKIQKSVIIIKFSPYMHHPHLIPMHLQGRCTPIYLV
jgi:hypothetical protein